MAYQSKREVYEMEGIVTTVHPHMLKAMGKQDGWSCDGRNQPQGCKGTPEDFLNRFRCTQCDFDLCASCTKLYEKPWGFATKIHKHPVYYFQNTDANWSCDGKNCVGGCRNKGQQLIRHRCDICDFDLCLECVQEFSVSHHVLGHQTMNHKNLLYKVPSNSNWFCNGKDFGGCKSAQLKQRYRSNESDFDFCDACLDAYEYKDKVHTKIHNHPLYNFGDNQKVPCSGYNFQGGCSTPNEGKYKCLKCNFSLCYNCVQKHNIPINEKKLYNLPVHTHPLEEIYLKSAQWLCDVCKTQKNNTAKGFQCIFKECDYQICEQCKNSYSQPQGQQYPGQYPAQQQQYPGQQYPNPGQQQYPGQQYPGQSFPGQQFPGQSFPGQQFPGQQFPQQQILPYPVEKGLKYGFQFNPSLPYGGWKLHKELKHTKLISQISTIFLKNDQTGTGKLDIPNELYNAVIDICEFVEVAPPPYELVVKLMEEFDFVQGKMALEQKEFKTLLKEFIGYYKYRLKQKKKRDTLQYNYFDIKVDPNVANTQKYKKIKAAERLFRKYDTNRKGFLTVQEFHNSMQELYDFFQDTQPDFERSHDVVEQFGVQNKNIIKELQFIKVVKKISKKYDID